jgi:hypothetical protein
MVCARHAQMCKSHQRPIMRNDLGASEPLIVVQGRKNPHEAIQNSVLTCEIMSAMFVASHDNVHGHFWASCFGAL